MTNDDLLFNPKNKSIMKKLFFAAAIVAAAMFASCGTTKQSASANSRSANPFGEVSEVPAAEYDTDEYFGATGIATGPKARMGDLQLVALANAQNMVRQKMKHAYKGMVRDYMKTFGNNEGSDLGSKLERGGDQVIDVIVNDTRASKGPLFSNVDDKGNVTCYIGIRVSKKDMADRIAKYVSEEEEMKMRFDEYKFREEMDNTFKEYKEN